MGTPPSHPRHATRVWDTILAVELPLNDPLAIAPVYCQKFVLHSGTALSIADLYTETYTVLWMGVEESAVVHSAIGWARSLEIGLGPWSSSWTCSHISFLSWTPT